MQGFAPNNLCLNNISVYHNKLQAQETQAIWNNQDFLSHLLEALQTTVDLPCETRLENWIRTIDSFFKPDNISDRQAETGNFPADLLGCLLALQNTGFSIQIVIPESEKNKSPEDNINPHTSEIRTTIKGKTDSSESIADKNIATDNLSLLETLVLCEKLLSSSEYPYIINNINNNANQISNSSPKSKENNNLYMGEILSALPSKNKQIASISNLINTFLKKQGITAKVENTSAQKLRISPSNNKYQVPFPEETSTRENAQQIEIPTTYKIKLNNLNVSLQQNTPNSIPRIAERHPTTGRESLSDFALSPLLFNTKKESTTATEHILNTRFIVEKHLPNLSSDRISRLSSIYSTNMQKEGKATNDIQKSEIHTSKLPHKNVIRQIANNITTDMPEGIHEIQLQLKPKHLGMVKLEITVNNHEVAAKILTANPLTQQMIEQGVEHLKTLLQNKGFTLNYFNVSVSNGGKEGNFADTYKEKMKFLKAIGKNQGEKIENIPDSTFMTINQLTLKNTKYNLDFWI